MVTASKSSGVKVGRKFAKVFGEYGFLGGRQVVAIAAPAGKIREVARLWKQLDDADAVEQDEIREKLGRLGALVAE